jgi:hypothetical protein
MSGNLFLIRIRLYSETFSSNYKTMYKFRMIDVKLNQLLAKLIISLAENNVYSFLQPTALNFMFQLNTLSLLNSYRGILDTVKYKLYKYVQQTF